MIQEGYAVSLIFDIDGNSGDRRRPLPLLCTSHNPPTIMFCVMQTRVVRDRERGTNILSCDERTGNFSKKRSTDETNEKRLVSFVFVMISSLIVNVFLAIIICLII
jgi:hypothetical protein